MNFSLCCMEGDKDSAISFYSSTLRKNMETFGQVDWVLRRWRRKIKSYVHAIAELQARQRPAHHRHKKNLYS